MPTRKRPIASTPKVRACQSGAPGMPLRSWVAGKTSSKIIRRTPGTVIVRVRRCLGTCEVTISPFYSLARRKRYGHKGSIEMGARLYVPALARFLQTDPVEEATFFANAGLGGVVPVDMCGISWSEDGRC